MLSIDIFVPAGELLSVQMGVFRRVGMKGRSVKNNCSATSTNDTLWSRIKQSIDILRQYYWHLVRGCPCSSETRQSRAFQQRMFPLSPTLYVISSREVRSSRPVQQV